jgi:thioesterase domain-containing protein
VRAGERSQPLLLWIPQAGGTTLALQRLASLLPAGIELMGFEAPPHRGLPEPESLADLAAAYADDVRQLARAGAIGPHRPFILAGNSFGATLAHEVARQLFDDCPPDEVRLVDPLLAAPPSPSRTKRVELWAQRKKIRAVQHTNRTRTRVARRVQRLRRAVRRARGGPPLPPAAPEVPMPATLVQAQAMSARLRTSHESQVYPGSVVLITSDVRRREFSDDYVGVRPYVRGELTVHPLPGRHGGMIADARVHQVVAVIEGLVTRLQR